MGWMYGLGSESIVGFCRLCWWADLSAWHCRTKQGKCFLSLAAAVSRVSGAEVLAVRGWCRDPSCGLRKYQTGGLKLFKDE